MRKKREKTYSIEEVRESMGQYLDSSIARLRLRLKLAWKKQASVKQQLYGKVAI